MAFSRSSKRALVVLIPFLIILLTSCGNPAPTEKATGSAEKNIPSSGESLFLQQCAICHGADGTLGASGASDLSVSKLDSLKVSKTIINGKNNMPAMKVLLQSDSNVAKVTAHVLKLRK